MKTKNPIKTVALLIGFQGSTKVWRLPLRLIISMCSLILSGKSNGFIDYKYQSDLAWISSSTDLKEERYSLIFKI